MDADLRQKLIAAPEMLLEDVEIMRALVAANDRALGDNIIDMRGIAMQRLEARLDRLEDTHRSVIAAAYENLAGTQQIHRAILRLLEAASIEDLIAALDEDIAAILRIDGVRLILESKADAPDAAVARLSTLSVVPAGFVDGYLGRGATRIVTLRPLPEGATGGLYGPLSPDLRSEACLRLDLGTGRLPGLLLLAARDPAMFTAQQGTDLMVFFANVFERVMRRWLDA